MTIWPRRWVLLTSRYSAKRNQRVAILSSQTCRCRLTPSGETAKMMAANRRGGDPPGGAANQEIDQGAGGERDRHHQDAGGVDGHAEGAEPTDEFGPQPDHRPAERWMVVGVGVVRQFVLGEHRPRRADIGPLVRLEVREIEDVQRGEEAGHGHYRAQRDRVDDPQAGLATTLPVGGAPTARTRDDRLLLPRCPAGCVSVSVGRSSVAIAACWCEPALPKA